jgi:hypothetical protein
MTQSIPEKTSVEQIQDQRFTQMIAEEEASNGEVGCGQLANSDFLAYLNNRSINIDDDNLRILLQRHLGHILTERDFDSIISQVNRSVESVVASRNALPTNILQHQAEIVEHIPAAILQQFFKVELGEFLADAAIGQVIKLTHSFIHKAVLQPRHTWPNPIWVLKSAYVFYITQAASLDEAIEKVRVQHPQEIGELEVVKVGGVLAPNQVIALDVNGIELGRGRV